MYVCTCIKFARIEFPSKVSANSSGIGFAGGDYLARTLEMQPLEDQAEILGM